MQFGDILRELLEERDITQKQLSQDLCLAPSTLGNYVRNLREPDYVTLKRIADYFHVTTDYLLDYDSSSLKIGHNDERLLRIYDTMDESTKELFLEVGDLMKKRRSAEGN